MNSRLFELSRKFYTVKLWKKLGMNDIFAIPLSDNRTGYVSVLGKEKDFDTGIALFIGEDGIDSLRTAMDCPYPDFGDSALQQRHLIIYFADKTEIFEEAYDDAVLYQKQSGKSFAKKGWPIFVKAVPYHLGSSELSKQDEADLITMLEYSIEMGQQLKYSDMAELGFIPFRGGPDEAAIPEIALVNGLYQVSQIIVPKQAKPEYTPVSFENDILFKKLEKVRKNGTLLCQLGGFFDEYLVNKQEQFPFMIFAVKKGNEAVFCDEKAYDYEEHPEHLLNQFLQKLAEEKYLPKKFIVRNEKTAAFLQNAAQKLGCELEIQEDLPDLDNAIQLYSTEEESLDPDNISEDDIMDFLQMTAALPDSFFNTMPEDARNSIQDILNLHVLPDDLQEKLDERLNGTTKKGRRSSAQKKSSEGKKAGKKKVSGSRSYVISVSPYAGCYRHIRVATDIRLSDLASIILDAFDFQDDHMYSFFMDNRAWNPNYEYARQAERGSFGARTMSARSHTLEETLIRDDGKFLFLFDYGDEWKFSCHVLREIPEPTSGYMIVRSKGDAPQQYGDL